MDNCCDYDSESSRHDGDIRCARERARLASSVAVYDRREETAMSQTQPATPAVVAGFAARRRLPKLARMAGSSPAALAAYAAAKRAAGLTR